VSGLGAVFDSRGPAHSRLRSRWPCPCLSLREETRRSRGLYSLKLKNLPAWPPPRRGLFRPGRIHPAWAMTASGPSPAVHRVKFFRLCCALERGRWRPSRRRSRDRRAFLLAGAGRNRPPTWPARRGRDDSRPFALSENPLAVKRDSPRRQWPDAKSSRSWRHREVPCRALPRGIRALLDQQRVLDHRITRVGFVCALFGPSRYESDLVGAAEWPRRRPWAEPPWVAGSKLTLCTPAVSSESHRDVRGQGVHKTSAPIRRATSGRVNEMGTGFWKPHRWPARLSAQAHRVDPSPVVGRRDGVARCILIGPGDGLRPSMIGAR